MSFTTKYLPLQLEKVCFRVAPSLHTFYSLDLKTLLQVICNTWNFTWWYRYFTESNWSFWSTWKHYINSGLFSIYVDLGLQVKIQFRLQKIECWELCWKSIRKSFLEEKEMSPGMNNGWNLKLPCLVENCSQTY